jgi:hypothetical protein
MIRCTQRIITDTSTLLISGSENNHARLITNKALSNAHLTRLVPTIRSATTNSTSLYHNLWVNYLQRQVVATGTRPQLLNLSEDGFPLTRFWIRHLLVFFEQSFNIKYYKKKEDKWEMKAVEDVVGEGVIGSKPIWADRKEDVVAQPHI